MVKKIDNEKVLEMFKAGVPQKDIAQHFNVSCPAICKKLKRLLPAPESVLDKYNFTDQQKQFVIEKAKGKTNTQAALASYEAGSLQSAKVIGSNLMAKPEVQQSINELLDTVGLTRLYRVRRLKQHIDSALPDISLKGLDMSFKLDGSFSDKSAAAGVTIMATNFQVVLSPSEVEKYADNIDNIETIEIKK